MCCAPVDSGVVSVPGCVVISGVTLDDNNTAWETTGRSFVNKPNGGNGKITRRTKRKWRKNESEERPETSGDTSEKNREGRTSSGW